MDWTLTMSFDGPCGESIRYSIKLDHTVARDIWKIEPPTEFDFPGWGKTPFTMTVERIRVREFRKTLFINEARRLGLLIAERMEDAEGWHEESRIGPARRSLGMKDKADD